MDTLVHVSLVNSCKHTCTLIIYWCSIIDFCFNVNRLHKYPVFIKSGRPNYMYLCFPINILIKTLFTWQEIKLGEIKLVYDPFKNKLRSRVSVLALDIARKLNVVHSVYCEPFAWQTSLLVFRYPEGADREGVLYLEVSS